MKNDKEVKKVENPPPIKQNDGGKGSSPRPVDKNTYRKNWNRIFKND